jgi:hypothetical protein
MNTENSSSPKEMFPFIILAISVILLLAWQAQGIGSRQFAARSTDNKQASHAPYDTATLDQFLTWQSKLIDDRRAELKTSKVKLADYVTQEIPKLDDSMEKSKKAETATEDLAKELLDLAKTDEDAKHIIDKYGIKQTKPSGSPDTEK